MKHTQGEWTIVGNDFETIIATAHRNIGSVFGLGGEAEANAHLIAAAPRMYEALEAIITEDGAACFNAPLGKRIAYMERRLEAINDIAHAAIAKAKGE